MDRRVILGGHAQRSSLKVEFTLSDTRLRAMMHFGKEIEHGALGDVRLL